VKQKWTGAWLFVVALVLALVPITANAASLPAPSMLTPSAGATVDQPLFSWTPVAGAAHYEIEVALDDQFVTVTDPPQPTDPVAVDEPRPVHGTTYIPTFTYSAKTHYWHVRAVGTDGTKGQWSASGTFTRRWTNDDEATGVQADDPASRVENVRLLNGGTTPALNDIAITWDPVPGAAYYQLQIAPTGSPDETITCETPHVVVAPAYENDYQRRDPLDTCAPVMSPIRSWTDATAWSETSPGRIAIESTLGRTGELVYVRFMDADGESQIVAPFAAEIESAGGDPRTFTISGSGPADPEAIAQFLVVEFPIEAQRAYTARVRAVDFIVEPDYPAIDPTPVVGMWSNERREPGEPRPSSLVFTPTDPISGTGSLFDPVIPRNLAQTDSDVPVLSWEPADGAVAYRVVIALDRDFTNRVAEYRTRAAVFVPPETYDDNGPAGTYYWFASPCRYDPLDPSQGQVTCRVADSEAINDPRYVGRFSKRSEPVLDLTATAFDDDRNVLLRWGDALTSALAVPSNSTPGGVERYQIQLTTGNWSASVDAQTDNLAYSTALEPLSPGEYRWRVRPLDGQSVPLAWAYGPDFTIGEPDEPSPSPTSPTPQPSTSPSPTSPGIPGTSPAPTGPPPVYQAPGADEGVAAEIAPDPPGKPRVTKVSKRRVRVHWRESEELGQPVSAYLVYRSTNGASFKRVRSTTSQTTRIKAKRGRTYWFYVIADSDAGRSGQSLTTRFRMPR
jgi:hypothetical protein